MSDRTGCPLKGRALTGRSRVRQLVLASLVTILGTAVMPSVGHADIITILAGDKDSLGTGLPLGDPVTLANAVNTIEDGAAFDQRVRNPVEWSYAYALPIGHDIVGAWLTLLTYDLEDAGGCDGWGAAYCEDHLFVNGIEVPGAFDDVHTPDLPAYGFVPPNWVTLALGPEFYSTLATGVVTVQFDNRGPLFSDHVWIDFAELGLATEPTRVPEPSTVTLLFGGLAMLTAGRSRAKWGKRR